MADKGRSAVAAGLMVSVATVLALTLLVAGGTAAPVRFDAAVSSFTRSWTQSAPWAVSAADAVGTLTEPLLAGIGAAVLAVLLIARGYRAAAGLVALSGVMGVLVTTLLKLAVMRDRPPGSAAYVVSTDTSFPSGHASAGIYLFLAAGLVLLRLGGRLTAPAGIALIVLGPLIGVSRLILGVHWPTDIICGQAVGSAALCTAALVLWQRLDAGWRAAPARR